MAAALLVDWNEVKTVALAIGVREAARQMGLSEEAVKRRCSREGWLTVEEATERRMEAIQADVRQQRGMSPSVPTAAEILKRTGPNTRAKLAIAVEKQADNLAELDGQELVMMAQTVGTVINGAAKLHSWAVNIQGEVRLDVLASCSSDPSPILDV